ncbi:MAG: hypothetical protein F6K30_03425 [Cyanothece sp. SIO2G6]|nr:hypothetical protein [Cyanothece sp. SIO2G6]
MSSDRPFTSSMRSPPSNPNAIAPSSHRMRSPPHPTTSITLQYSFHKKAIASHPRKAIALLLTHAIALGY